MSAQDEPARATVPLVERPDALRFAKTISESDVYLFAGVTGDFSALHVNAEYAATMETGERVAHGALLLGLMSAAAARWCAREDLVDTLSYGYDRLRFIRPVRFGDTITVHIALEREIPAERKLIAAVEAYNQHGEIVGAATHILWRMRGA